MFNVDYDRRLRALGWTPFFHQQFLGLEQSPSLEGARPERVAFEGRSRYTLVGSGESRPALLAGKLHDEGALRPAVGDWVLATSGELGRIEHVFERATAFQRKASGRTSEAQVIAANVDVAFIVAALAPAEDGEALEHTLSVPRVERYVRAVSGAGVRPVIVVNKADVRSTAEEATALVHERLRALAGVDVLLVSAATGAGIDALAASIGESETAVLVGSSGVGKSSLTNRLLQQDAQHVSEVREEDGRGRHTTTHRALFALPNGGVLVDTPGMRELGLYADDDDLDVNQTGFDDVDAFAEKCRFADCAHTTEPGCAVLDAVMAGTLSVQRLASAKKLQRELARQRDRQDALARSATKKGYKAMSRQLRGYIELRGKR